MSRVAVEFDVPMELDLLQRSFVETRRGGGEWCTMALLYDVKGRPTPSMLPLESSDDVTGMLSLLIVVRDAHHVLVAQDAWFNTMTDDLDDPTYLRPSNDPLAHEVMVVTFVTVDDVLVRSLPYALVQGEVTWETEHDLSGGVTSSRMAPVLQEALRLARAR
jgi:hypothetical protein